MTNSYHEDPQPFDIEPGELGRLRDAFASIGEISTPGADCPAPETIWAARRRELAASEIELVVNHMAGCGVCAEAWRIAVAAPQELEEVGSEAPASASGERARARAGRGAGGGATAWKRPWAWWLGAALPAAAAAALLLFVGLRYVGQPPSPTPTMRGGTESAIESVVAASSLPRDAFRLEWSGAPPGSVYELDVVFAAGDELRTVATARNLTEPSYEIGTTTLADLPSGASLDWQVSALLPDGGRLTSPTFTTAIR